MPNVVVETAELMCDMGSSPCSLLAIEAVTINVTGEIVALVTDNEFGANIEGFGTCTILSAIEETDAECTMEPAGEWLIGSLTTKFEGATAVLTNDSVLMCSFGGEITIESPGEEIVEAV